MKTNTTHQFTLLCRSVFLSTSLVLAHSALGAGNVTDSPTIADLIYDPATGNVKMDATEAGGAKITNFQLENFDSTFVPANYNSLAGTGSFGGIFEDVTTLVIADTDFTNTGFTGIYDFGNVFPTGLNQLGLQVYLKTANYTGASGSGQLALDLVVVGAGPFVLDFAIAENGGGPGFDLTWSNREFKTYDFNSSTDLASWEPFDPDGPGGPTEPFFALPYSGSETNSLTVDTPSDPRRFFQIVENNEVLYAENFDGAEFAGGFPAGWVAEATATVDFTTFPNGLGGENLPEVPTAWEVGAPSGGPSDGYVVYDAFRDGPLAPNSGARCAGTNLTKSYCGRAWYVTLTTPAILIENPSAPLLVSFQQWIAGATFTATVDEGRLLVLDALNGDAQVAILADIFNNNVWSKNELSIPVETVAALTKNGSGESSIKLQFTFSSSDNASMTDPDPIAGFRSPAAGFYVDDVKVEFNLSE